MAVAGGLAFREIAACNMSTCGIATDTLAYCWGTNEVGALGKPIVAH